MDLKLIPVFIIPALILIATSFAAKFGTVFVSARLLGVNKNMSAKAGFGLSASGGELALVTAKGGADVGATGAFLLPMIGTMTIITTFLSPYVIKFGWKLTQAVGVERKKNTTSTDSKTSDSGEIGAQVDLSVIMELHCL